MSQHVNESLSALMDDEANELEMRRILKEVAEDDALLQQWQRYHAVRDLMHDSTSRLPSRDLLSGIQAALADEPAHAVNTNAGSPAWYRRMSRPLAQGSIAATVAFAVLFSMHTLRSPESPAGSSAPGVQPGSVQLSANTNNRYVEGEFNRTVSFERRELDPQTLERLREAIYREFEHYSLAPQLPSLQVDSAQD